MCVGATVKTITATIAFVDVDANIVAIFVAILDVATVDFASRVVVVAAAPPDAPTFVDAYAHTTDDTTSIATATHTTVVFYNCWGWCCCCRWFYYCCYCCCYCCYSACAYVRACGCVSACTCMCLYVSVCLCGCMRVFVCVAVAFICADTGIVFDNVCVANVVIVAATTGAFAALIASLTDRKSVV